MTTHHSVSTVAYDTAAQIVAAGIRLAELAGVRAVVTVADPAMALVAFGRADGATPHSAETSRRKAITAASTRRPTAAMAPELIVALEHGSGGLLTSIKGGVPLFFDGVHVGGVGVAGGHPDVDAQIAADLLQEIGADAEVVR
ncbi:glc operon protein GlcG [Microbacterium trichothecenolyticum]|jgi:glc operon protein GlcG|uniref:GlcG/HbpS family heme-binding protein n=1 Tax=Microbacterium trichothecenolyticum TaxID=69370 RepID=UPI002863D94E|nr:heme-binding protein [Microbacterium trichothecenolyticum]MDR7114098.1 glc operon protein GlcG [Microbacterium trichothecenolyticum]